MSGTHAEYLKTGHFAGLDGLRLLAILPVIAHHATPRPLSGIAGKGAVGVDLFFVLSGFLITTLLLREHRVRGRVRLGRFFVRRALRIFPLYYAVLALYVGAALRQPADSPERAHLLGNLVYHASYTANWFVNYDVPHAVPFSFSWSLCVEEQFYLLWPWLVFALGSRTALLWTMSTWMALDVWLTHGGLALPAGGTAMRVSTSFSTAIGAGVLLSLVFDGPRGFAVLSRLLEGRWVAPLALCGVLGLLALPFTPYLALCAALAALVGAVVLGGGVFGALLDHPLAVWGGRLSYAAYLTHITALALVRRSFPSHADSFAFVFGLGLPLALALAFVAHVFVERPFLQLREHGR